MFKTGIYKLEQLKNLNGFFNRKKYISISLYPLIHLSSLNNKEELEEKILMHFSVSKNSFKRTHKERFDELDSKAIQQAQKYLSQKNNISVHDIAASDARTSVDFFEKLEKEFPGKINFQASDKDPYVYECTSKKNSDKKIITNEKGEILQIITPPFVFNMQIRESLILYPLNRLIERILSSNQLRKKILEIDDNCQKEKLILFSSKARETEANKTNFHLGAHDILKPATEKHDIIRIMNVFSERNFNEQNRKIIIDNLKNSMPDLGILIIGSNDYPGSPVNGNIFLKQNNKFTNLFESGTGVCFKELFTS